MVLGAATFLLVLIGVGVEMLFFDVRPCLYWQRGCVLGAGQGSFFEVCFGVESLIYGFFVLCSESVPLLWCANCFFVVCSEALSIKVCSWRER